MSYLVKQGGKTDYNYKEYMCDTASDIANINICLIMKGFG